MIRLEQIIPVSIVQEGTLSLKINFSGHLRVQSYRIESGDLFVALPGEHGRHGNDYIQDAKDRGAIGVLTDKIPSQPQLPYVVIPDLANEIFNISKTMYPVDWSKVMTVAVTGTNGKTSVTHQLAYMAKRLGFVPAIIGTLYNQGPNYQEVAMETTPHAVDCLRLIYRWQNNVVSGVLFVALEASSHALQQNRLRQLPVDVAVLTNISQDHLDYHHDMLRYKQAKAKIFAQPGGHHACAAVLMVDDSLFIETAQKTRQVIVAAKQNRLKLLAFDLRANQTEIHLQADGEEVVTTIAAAGSFQIENALTSILTMMQLNVDARRASLALADWQAPSGRLELVWQDPCYVYVDYAHTPDALEKTLTTIRQLIAGKLIVVFGCGGERDQQKRPKMGAVAATYADVTILTADNPRSEDPINIMSQIRQGMPSTATVYTQIDRRQAIAQALSIANFGDAVVIAGKGHERTQSIAGKLYPFSDQDEVKLWFKEHRQCA